jgi:hypothetical protein
MTRKVIAQPEEAIGWNNQHLDQTIQRMQRGGTYRDLSTVWICPTRGMLHHKVVSNWIGLMRPMNQAVAGPVFFEGDEVGVAYEKAFNWVLADPGLAKFKFILTTEEDNLIPSDGLLKLYEHIGDYDCIAGLYWTKSQVGFEGNSQPMIYGDPQIMPKNFIPQIPKPDTVQHCNGLGMGCNLWKIESLRKKLKDLPHPWFKTIQEVGRGYTQDLWFYQESAKFGFKVACATMVKVGHLDVSNGMVW